MKKINILVIVTILLSSMVSAVSLEELPECAKIKQCITDNYGQEVDIYCDLNNDGKVDLIDIGVLSQNVNTEGWCLSVLPVDQPQECIVKNYYTSTYSGGGTSDSSVWRIVAGDWSLKKLFGSIKEYFDTIYISRDEFNFMQYRYEEKLCKLTYGTGQMFNYCLTDAIETIYGEGCEWEWVKGEKVMLCP